jgi:hypothetical protein
MRSIQSPVISNRAGDTVTRRTLALRQSIGQGARRQKTTVLVADNQPAPGPSPRYPRQHVGPDHFQPRRCPDHLNPRVTVRCLGNVGGDGTRKATSTPRQ